MSNKELIGVPTEAIPPLGAPARQMLDMYLSGDAISEDELCEEFGRNYRTIFQALRGDRYLHWRFLDLVEDGVIEARYIDPRHLSQDRNLDALARAERKAELKSDSHREAMSGANRVKSAFEELEEARAKLSELLELKKALSV
ncbi:hypothetical protein BCT06_12730 [Vibrio breoganii]|uniref:hypothetical protein n=1 Tax=Vibrio breoganii TaxID=553239 RepID=UPI000C82AE16|nr:hypothetical protein [Vibrio breoganii]PMO60355.1 hypothetical protein BCT06_12730 [Vibrio breoganii]